MEQKFKIKHLLENKNVIIYTLVFILLSTVALTAYVGYNEYAYRKIGVCFSENNYDLAEYYIESISPTYKDAEKIKSLIHTVKNFDETNINDYNRTIKILDSYKGFSNVNVNYCYNSFYHRVICLSENVPVQQTPSADNMPVTENAPGVTFPFENSTMGTTVAAATVPSSSTQNSDSLIVYYVESGEVYHINSNCRSLANSNKILSGPIPEGRRVCKVCGDG